MPISVWKVLRPKLRLAPHKILRDGLANTAGSILRLLLAVASVPLLVHQLGLTTFGHLSILTAIINIGTLSEWGISTACTIKIASAAGDLARQKQISEFARKRSLRLASGFAILTFASAPIIGRLLLKGFGTEHDYQSFTTLGLTGLCIIARTDFQSSIAAMQGLLRFTRASSLQTGWFYANQVALIIVSLFSNNLTALATSMLVAALLSSFFARKAFVHIIGPTDPNIQTDPTLLTEIRPIAKEIGMTNAANALFSHADKLVAGMFLASDDVGVYSAFAAIAGQVNIIASSLSQPAISHIATPKSQSERAKIFISSFRITATAIVVATSCVVLSKEFAIPILLPAVSQLKLLPLSLLVGAYGLFSLHAPAYYTLQATGNGAFVRKVVVFSSISTLFTMVVLARFFGLLGISASAFMYSLVFVLSWKVSRLLNIQRRLLPEISIAAATIAVVLPIASSTDTITKLFLSPLIVLPLVALLAHNALYLNSRNSGAP